MTVLAPTITTTEELLALPENGMDRWLIRGELKERPMTVRNRVHCRVTTKVARYLDVWLDEQPEPRGEVLSGEAGFRLSRNPDTTVGIDVAYVSAEVLAGQTGRVRVVEGVPVLAVEVLSPSDTQEQIDDKLAEYRTARVPVVWVIDPTDRTVLIYRGGSAPVLVNDTQELLGEPELPGFRVAVTRLFG